MCCGQAQRRGHTDRVVAWMGAPIEPNGARIWSQASGTRDNKGAPGRSPCSPRRSLVRSSYPPSWPSSEPPRSDRGCLQSARASERAGGGAAAKNGGEAREGDDGVNGLARRGWSCDELTLRHIGRCNATTRDGVNGTARVASSERLRRRRVMLPYLRTPTKELLLHICLFLHGRVLTNYPIY